MTLMIDDRDLDKTPDMPLGQPSSGPPLAPIAIVGALIVLFIAAGAFWMSRREQPAPAASNQSARAVTATDAAIDKPAEPPVVLPPLALMDGFLRPLLRALSSSPELARWLATDDLVRQLAAAIDQAADGNSPARDFKVLAPHARLTTRGTPLQRTIDPASFRRYDGLTAAVTSMDAGAVAKVYRTIRPRLNEAYQSMGNPNRDVDNALRNAIDILLDTPIVEGPIRVVEGDGASWAYADRRLESLLPTQKQIVRLGSANGEKVLTWLRALRDAL
jgi:hypothetical protein